jgi:hypothetical protein
MVCACAWVCVIVERAAVPSEVLGLTATPSERATGRAGPLVVSAISPIRPFVHRRRLPPQHARDSPSRPVNQNHAPERKRTGLQKPKTAAPREGQGVRVR